MGPGKYLTKRKSANGIQTEHVREGKLLGMRRRWGDITREGGALKQKQVFRWAEQETHTVDKEARKHNSRLPSTSGGSGKKRAGGRNVFQEPIK